MCCTLLVKNTGSKNYAKIAICLCTIAQLCRSISLQLRHISTSGEKLVKRQINMSSTCSHNVVNLGPHHVWKYGSDIHLRPLRIGEENRRKIETTDGKYNDLSYWVAVIKRRWRTARLHLLTIRPLYWTKTTESCLCRLVCIVTSRMRSHLVEKDTI